MISIRKCKVFIFRTVKQFRLSKSEIETLKFLESEFPNNVDVSTIINCVFIGKYNESLYEVLEYLVHSGCINALRDPRTSEPSCYHITSRGKKWLKSTLIYQRILTPITVLKLYLQRVTFFYTKEDKLMVQFQNFRIRYADISYENFPSVSTPIFLEYYFNFSKKVLITVL